jgi:uncharacterized protein with HEPN domain
MRPRSQKLLADVRLACQEIIDLTAQLSFEQFQSDRNLNHLIERKLEIAGEAIRQLEVSDSEVGNSLRSTRGFVGLRNVIAHQYADLDYQSIYSICRDLVPPLWSEVQTLLAGNDQ